MPDTATNPDGLLASLDEIAATLGVAKVTVKRMIKAGELPGVVRIHGRLKVKRAEFRAWLAADCPAITDNKTDKTDRTDRAEA